MLTQVTNGTNTYVYRYDGLGNRLVRIENSVEKRYVGGLAETDASGNITAYYVYGLGLISKITPSNQSYFYHFDGIASNIGISDSSGNMVNKYAYDAFGKVLNQEEAIPNSFKYVGQFGVMDEGNGIFYLRARYYDPEVGRFISKDPIGFLGGLNVFTYVENDPIDLIDPLGLDYWVEGAVEGEAGLGFHQSICVGKRNGARMCISFGRMPGQGDCYFKCKGHIYQDKSAPGDIYQNYYRVTSNETDIKIRKHFASLLGTEGRWDVLLGQNCRSFSQDMFSYLLKTYGGTPRVSP